MPRTLTRTVHVSSGLRSVGGCPRTIDPRTPTWAPRCIFFLERDAKSFLVDHAVALFISCTGWVTSGHTLPRLAKIRSLTERRDGHQQRCGSPLF